MQWFRFYSEFAHDPKIRTLPTSVQLYFVLLLCMKCDNLLPNSCTNVAHFLRIRTSKWQQVKSILVKNDMITEDNDIKHWNKRQYISDTSTARVRKYREKVKRYETVTVTAPEQNRTDTEQNRLKEYKEKDSPAKSKIDFAINKFEEFKLIYPPRSGDQNWTGALRNWKSNIRKKINPDEMIQGAIRFKQYSTAKNQIGTEFIYKASNFLGRDQHFKKTWEITNATTATHKPKSTATRIFDDFEQTYAEAKSRGIV